VVTSTLGENEARTGRGFGLRRLGLALDGRDHVNEPTNLRDCYLRVAMEKSTADMAYLAREICDAVFKPAHRSLVVLDGKNGVCTEWWLDPQGRYDTATVYCAFEPAPGEGRYTLACQYKDRPHNYTLVEVAEHGDALEPVGKVAGIDPGRLFKSMAGCVRAKAASGGP
jgi:hypothetical protein